MKMSFIFIIFIGILVLIMPCQGYGSSYVPVTHRVYDFLERMEHHYLILGARLGAKPTTRSNIASLLVQINNNMDNLSENMSRLEQQGQELVMKLGTLTEQIGSYKEATDTLQETSQKIESLIETARGLTEESVAIIAKFNEISGPNLVKRTGDIENKLGGLENALKVNQESMDDTKVKLDEIDAHLNISIKKSKYRFSFACGGIVLIIVIQLIKIFIIDGISISEILTNLRNLK